MWWRVEGGGLGDAVVVVAFSVGEPATKLGAVCGNAGQGPGDRMRRRFEGGCVGDELSVPTHMS